MRQGYFLLLMLACLMTGCASKSSWVKVQGADYGYLFEDDLEPVNTKNEKDKLLKRIENGK